MNHSTPQTARALVVSIHDVSGLTWPAVEAMLGDLAACGVERVSLLVIPDHHHRAPMREDARFCEWLAGKAAAGHETVVHGYYHCRERSPREGWRRIITEFYTAGEGEFYDLDQSEAGRRLDRARDDFRAAGLAPAGFIAPAWLLGAGAAEAVRSCGFRYTTRIGRVEDLVFDATHRSQSLCYSVRAAWRQACSMAWNRILLESLRSNPLVRIGLHPPDWEHPPIRRHALDCVRRALAGREAMTYETWLERRSPAAF